VQSPAEAQLAILQFLKQEKALYKKILTYEPLNLSEVLEELQINGVKISKANLCMTLDSLVRFAYFCLFTVFLNVMRATISMKYSISLLYRIEQGIARWDPAERRSRLP
jgi:hypothetical protein